LLYVTHLYVAAEPDNPEYRDTLTNQYSHRREQARIRAVGVHTAPDYDWKQHLLERMMRRGPLPGQQPTAYRPRQRPSQPSSLKEAWEELNTLEERCDVWQATVYAALRTYYGERGLPPLGLFLAMREDPYVMIDWYNWSESQFGIGCLTQFWDHRSDDPLFLWVANPKGSVDLLTWEDEVGLDLWFRHKCYDTAGDDSPLVETLLLPLERARIATCEAETPHALEVSYVWQEARLRTSSVAELLHAMHTSLE
jgi:hypothetical protein